MKLNCLRVWSVFLLIACLSPASASEPWAGPGAADALQAEMAAFFEGSENRIVGSPGNVAMEKKIAALFAETGFEHGEIRFPAMRFVPGPAMLTLPDGATVPLHAMHPTWLRPGNFPEPRFDARLVYLGRGEIGDLAAVSGVDLSGAIAVMDFASGAAWEGLLRFGIRGFLFLGADEMDYRDAAAKVSNSEVAVPRYYVTPGDAAAVLAACGRARVCDARVEAEPSRWEKHFARNLWVIVPGSDPQLAREMPVILAPMDGNNAVPGLGQSARAGANLFLLTRLLERFRARRPGRSVMLAAVNAHTQYYLGERALAWYLLASPVEIEQVRNTLSADLRIQELLAEQYAALTLDGSNEKADSERLIAFRDRTDDSIGRIITVKEPIVARAKRDVNEIKGERARLEREKDKINLEIRRLNEADETTEAERLQGQIRDIQARLDDYAVNQVKYVNVLTLFNKVGIKTVLADLNAEERDILKDYVRDILDTNRRSAELNRRDLQVSLANGAIRRATQDYTVPFAVTLELTWQEARIGFSSFSGVSPSRRWAPPWGVNSMRIAGELEAVAAGRRRNLLVDTLTNYGGLPESHYIKTATPAIGFFHGASQTPAFSLNTPFVSYGPVFTPADRFDRFDYAAAAETMAFTPDLLQAILDDPAITRSTELIKPPQDLVAWSTQIKTYKFDEFAASVLPQLPVSGSLVILYAAEARQMFGETPNVYTALTDERAAAIFYGLREKLSLNSAAYRLTPDFTQVDHIIDAGEAHTKVPSTVPRGANRIFALFPCVEFPVFSFHDSSLISASSIDVGTRPYLLLSGGKNSAPRKFGMTGASTTFSSKVAPMDLTGPAAFYLHAEDRIKLLTGNKRLALNASPEKPDGIGFQTGEMGPDFFAIAVRDMAILNADRLGGLKGVTDELAQDFLRRGREAAARMEEALARLDYPAYLRHLYAALGAHVKSYEQTSATTNDMLKAVIFYMALLLPFCFFLEKMIFTVSRIEVEMGIFATLFVGTFLLFRFIHPAFRVAQYPEAIFLGFIMLSLGLFVISILHGRFEGEMQILMRNLSSAEYAEVGYSTVGQQAMLIGVNNMKKRRIRTALTTATIVLVTFTMLSFTSISRRMSPTLVARSAQAPYTGILYNWPGNSRMDEGTYFAVRAMFADRADVIERHWILPEKVGGVSVPLRLDAEDGKTALVDAILGLMPEEDGFLQSIPVVAGRFFSADNATEVILPASLAQVLGIPAEQVGTASVTLQGQAYTVVGILDEELFRNILDINGRPLTPIKDLIRQASGMHADEGAAVTEEDMDDSGVFYVETSALLLMPAQTARRIGAQPYSLSIRLRDESEIWEAVEYMLTATSAKIFMASRAPFVVGDQDKGRENKPGVYFIGSGFRTSIGGLTMLIIPLLIASTIILNTMLGSVFERKKEIAIYNAVGLNPTHIGLFFLAESFVYGVIGSVGGYLIGQFLSLALNKFGLVSDINLNFSSLSVAYVILFTISVVLLSTLYPAIVATKAAVPSGKRKWSMPPTDGTRMTVVFPFIYQEPLLPGIMSYLDEYFSQFTEASTGDIIATPARKELARDADGRPVYTLAFQVALAPFDLGVTQTTAFVAAYDPLVSSFRITMTTNRISGQDTNWITTNKPFLERLRKHMMQWRNLDAAQHALFVRKGSELFA